IQPFYRTGIFTARSKGGIIFLMTLTEPAGHGLPFFRQRYPQAAPPLRPATFAPLRCLFQRNRNPGANPLNR
ncbi:MAG: hypothetical protein WBE38_04950, partial [Terracidiphilus sp.]